MCLLPVGEKSLLFWLITSMQCFAMFVDRLGVIQLWWRWRRCHLYLPWGQTAGHKEGHGRSRLQHDAERRGARAHQQPHVGRLPRDGTGTEAGVHPSWSPQRGGTSLSPVAMTTCPTNHRLLSSLLLPVVNLCPFGILLEFFTLLSHSHPPTHPPTLQSRQNENWSSEFSHVKERLEKSIACQKHPIQIFFRNSELHEINYFYRCLSDL